MKIVRGFFSRSLIVYILLYRLILLYYIIFKNMRYILNYIFNCGNFIFRILTHFETYNSKKFYVARENTKEF